MELHQPLVAAAGHQQIVFDLPHAQRAGAQHRVDQRVPPGDGRRVRRGDVDDLCRSVRRSGQGGADERGDQGGAAHRPSRATNGKNDAF